MKRMSDLRTREEVKEVCMKELAFMPFFPMLLDHIKRIMSSVPRTTEDLTKAKAAKQKFAQVMECKKFQLNRCPKPLCNCIKEQEEELDDIMLKLCEFADKEPAAAFTMAVMAEVNMHLGLSVRPLCKAVEDMAIHLHRAIEEFMDGDKDRMERDGRFKWGARPEGSNPDVSHMIRDAFLIPPDEFEVQFIPPAVLEEKFDRAKSKQNAISILEEMFGKIPK